MPTTPDARVLPTVTRPDPPAPTRHQLLVTLVDSDPLVWHRLAVPSTPTLAKLHQVLQAALGWTDRHLHQFVAADTTYGDPELPSDDPPQASTRRTTLAQVAPGVGASMQYAYDFGDGRRHLIVIGHLPWGDPGAQGSSAWPGAGPARPRTATEWHR